MSTNGENKTKPSLSGGMTTTILSLKAYELGLQDPSPKTTNRQIVEDMVKASGNTDLWVAYDEGRADASKPRYPNLP
jgi:hypothetical protein